MSRFNSGSSAWAALIGGMGRAYSLVFFFGDFRLSFIFALATMFNPVAGLAGLGGAFLTGCFALLLGFHRESVSSGIFGVNGLLVGLALGSWFQPAPGAAVMLAAAAAGGALLTGAAVHLLGDKANLPVLSLPFVITASLVFLASAGLEPAAARSGAWSTAWPALTSLPVFLREYLLALAAVFFQDSPVSGLLILIGLLLKSRLAVVLTLLGLLTGRVLALALGADFHGFPAQIMGFNLMLTSLAVGGIFFIPSPASFMAAAAAALFGGLVTLALGTTELTSSLPLLAWPFNLVVLAFLSAARSRRGTAEPTAVDFIPDSPERNLDYHLTRIGRNPGLTRPVFRLPLAGLWRVSQGPEGRFTHQGPWSQAWDFEGPEEEQPPSDGEPPWVFSAYNQPVLAGAAGTVVKVVDGVPDNLIGSMDLENRWGNLVLLRHQGGFHSLYAHLRPGSIQVEEGQYAAEGRELGRLGSSGRAPRPHLHFHCQTSPRIGSSAVPAEFVHFLERNGDSERFVFAGSPREGVRLSSPEAHPEFRTALNPAREERLVFSVEQNGRRRRETWTVESDLINGEFILCLETGARCFFHLTPEALILTDYQGPSAGGLRAFYLAVSRTPFCYRPGRIWDDIPPLRSGLKGWAGPVVEIFRPFMDLAEVKAEKVFMPPRFNGSELCFGVSTRFQTISRLPVAGPQTRLEAWFSPGLGPISVKMFENDLPVVSVANESNMERSFETCVIGQKEPAC